MASEIIHNFDKHKSVSRIFGITCSVILLLVQFHACTSIGSSQYEIGGCDPFGYARQARLFRQANHPLDGFNTDLQDKAYQHLKRWAQSTELNQKDWFQMVAPHCHHYRPSSDKLIIQYPFGTGWLMSLFPEEYERRWLAIGSLSIATTLGIFKLNQEKSPLLQVFRTFNTLILINTIQIFWSRSDSLAPSILIAYISAEMALTYVKTPPKRIQSLTTLSIILGLLLGFSITIRPGNLFFWFAGLLVIGLIACSNPAQHQALKRIIGWGGVSLLPGTLANFYFNAVNTGSAFVTTYTPKDTRLTDNPEIILSNYSKLGNGDGRILLLICSGLVGITLIKLMGSGRLSKHNHACLKLSAIMFTGWGSLILLLLLSTAKIVFLPHYLACQVIFTSTLVCCSDVDKGNTTPLGQVSRHKALAQWSDHIRTMVMTLSSIVIMLQTFSQSNITQPTDNPLVGIDRENSVIWAADIGSYFFYYYGLPTAKLLDANSESQNQAIDYLQREGVNQYFIDEYKIPELVQLLKPDKRQLKKVGEFRQKSIYLLEP